MDEFGQEMRTGLLSVSGGLLGTWSVVSMQDGAATAQVVLGRSMAR